MRLDIPSFSSEQDSLSDITKLDIPRNANGYRDKAAVRAVTYGYKGESDESDGIFLSFLQEQKDYKKIYKKAVTFVTVQCVRHTESEHHSLRYIQKYAFPY